MKTSYKQEANIFKSLSDETRLCIVKMLATGEEMCGCVLLEKLPISQPSLSYHMKILLASGLVSSRKMGTQTMYTLCLEQARFLHGLLDEIFNKKNQGL